MYDTRMKVIMSIARSWFCVYIATVLLASSAVWSLCIEGLTDRNDPNARSEVSPNQDALDKAAAALARDALMAKVASDLAPFETPELYAKFARIMEINLSMLRGLGLDEAQLASAAAKLAELIANPDAVFDGPLSPGDVDLASSLTALIMGEMFPPNCDEEMGADGLLPGETQWEGAGPGTGVDPGTGLDPTLVADPAPISDVQVYLEPKVVEDRYVEAFLKAAGEILSDLSEAATMDPISASARIDKVKYDLIDLFQFRDLTC